MDTWLERYQQGEREQVWQELIALGEDVHHPDLLDSAYAVARETMKRTRHNIEMLVARLSGLGFQFGYDWVFERMARGNGDSDWTRWLIENELTPPPPFAPPPQGTDERLEALEQEVGPLPLSLRAWYEEVGCANLVGLFPVDDLGRYQRFLSTAQSVALGQEFKDQLQQKRQEWPCHHDIDPLWVYPLSIAREGILQPAYSERRYVLSLAPDEYFKYLYPGGGTYSIALPCGAADAVLDGEWHHTYFVDYLRQCFQWAGFPGLACRPSVPQSELEYLTENLLPI